MTKYTTIQILECARNFAMKKEKESVSTDPRRPKTGCAYNGRLGFTREYTKKVANLYAVNRESNEEKVKEMNEEGHVGTTESLKRVQRQRVKLFRDTASLLILKYHDIQY
jgi:hypothetical protein